MILRDCLVRAGIVDSEKVSRLRPAAQLFFRNLLHVCDGAARFEADADRLRTVLYGRVLSKVSKADVARWLLECRQADLIALYTRDGRGYGKVLNYGQRDTKRRVLYPGEEDDPGLFTIPPAAPSAGLEVKGREFPPSPPPAGGRIASPRLPENRKFRVRNRQLDTLKETKRELEAEMGDILRPGGCAYATEPTDPQKKAWLDSLRARHKTITAELENAQKQSAA